MTHIHSVMLYVRPGEMETGKNVEFYTKHISIHVLLNTCSIVSILISIKTSGMINNNKLDSLGAFTFFSVRQNNLTAGFFGGEGCQHYKCTIYDTHLTHSNTLG